MYQKSLAGKTALVTGSSRGIGQQIAIGLAKLGCNIILHGRKKTNLDSSAKLLEQYNIQVARVEGELIEKELVESLIQQIKELNLTVDILYNNAALMTQFHSDFYQHTWNEWIDTYKVNVLAMYTLCSYYLPVMISEGYGRIINLSSGITNTPELMPYSVSKAAVDKLTKDFASRLEGTGVRINMLDPGWLRTDMGGPNAQHPVEAVLPGALAPALIENDGANGQFFSAINHNM